MAIRLIINTRNQRRTVEEIRQYRWRSVVDEVATYEVNGQVAAIVWETSAPEFARAQIGTLAEGLIGAFQFSNEQEELEYLRNLEQAHV
jgi:hypothetical protein